MRAALTFAALVLAAPAVAQEAESLSFACTDGRVVEIAFPDAATAVITVDGSEPVGLALIPPGDLAAGETVEDAAEAEEAAEGEVVDLPRYAGNGVQWIADGTAAGTLLVDGDTAVDGTACASTESLEAEVEDATGLDAETEAAPDAAQTE